MQCSSDYGRTRGLSEKISVGECPSFRAMRIHYGRLARSCWSIAQYRPWIPFVYTGRGVARIEGRILSRWILRRGGGRNDREKRLRRWLLLNNSSIRRDYGSTVWSSRHPIVGFPWKGPTLTFASSILSAILLHGVEEEKRKERERPIGQEKFPTCSRALSLRPPQLFGSSSVSSDLIVLLSTSLHPATRFSLYLLAWNFPLFEIERIVGSRKKKWPIEYATVGCRIGTRLFVDRLHAMHSNSSQRFFFFPFFLEVTRRPRMAMLYNGNKVRDGEKVFLSD